MCKQIRARAIFSLVLLTSLTTVMMAQSSTPPYVGYVAFWGITNTGITVSWSTDVLATTQLAYGTTPALGQFSPLQTAFTASHGVVLNNLNPGTTYYFAAESKGVNGITGSSAIYSFTTTGTGVPAPVISAVTATNISATSATITWTTDEASDSRVNYGVGGAYNMGIIDGSLVTSHSILLTGLTAGTTYGYFVSSQISSNTPAVSANFSFSTLGGSAPVISNITETAIGASTATINWTTDQPTTSLVNYGITNSYGASSLINTSLTMNHSVTLTGLSAGTTYDFDVVSTNSSNLQATSTNQMFSTLVLPGIPNISKVAASVSGTSVNITWTTDQPATSQVNYGTTTSYGSYTTVDTSLVTSHSVTLIGLSSGTTYDFDVVSANSSNAAATSGNYTFATPSTSATPPNVGYVAFWGISNSSVTISWSTDVPSTTQVAYGTVPNSLNQSSPLQTGMTASHGVILTGLTSGTTYYFIAQSTGTNGATGYSTIFVFSTTGSAPSAGAISNVTASNVTSTSATVTWNTDNASNSEVFYQGPALTEVGSPALVTSHSVTLTGLAPGTTYNYYVSSAVGAYPASTSTTYTFTTLAATAAPVISNISIACCISNAATISWTTDQPSDSRVHSGLTQAVSTTTSSTALVTNHSVTLLLLSPGDTYYFAVESVNSSGVSSGVSSDSSFLVSGAAQPASPPMVGYVAAWGITSTGATITWSTDVPANTEFEYAPASGPLGFITPLQTALTASHGVVLTGLKPGTTYNFVAQSTGANGATGLSQTLSFTTLGTSAP